MNRFTRFSYLSGYLFSFVIFIYSANSIAQIYKWQDEQGKTHYTQTPPPKNINTVKKLDIKNSQSNLSGSQAGDTKYCQSLRKYSVDVAKAMKRGVPSANVRNNIDALDDKLKEALGTNESVLTQVLYYIYGFKKIELSANEIANLVYKQCRSGNYGGSQAKNAQQENNHDTSSGTGWPIAQGYVVTNYHVVEERKNISIHTVSGNILKASLFKADKKNDIALLKVHTPDKLPLALPLSSEEEKLGAKVFTIGYPHPDLMGSKPKLTSGTISSLWGIRDDPRTYQISVPVQAGNSGGPLINMQGQVTGIVTSKLSAVKIFDWTGDLPQNVNYALKTHYLNELLSQLKTSDSLIDEQQNHSAKLAELATQLQDSILLITATKK